MTETDMTDQYAGLRAALYCKVTPGPWRLGGLNGVYAAEDKQVANTVMSRDARFVVAANPEVIRDLLAERDALRNALMDLLGAVNGLAPERNCSCHISPPCHDCIEYGGLRDAEEHARNVLMRDKREQS